MTQVITIHPDGGMSSLQRKKGQGIDLRQFGAVSIQRVTQIEWDEGEQAWFIHFVEGPRKGTEWNMAALQEMAGSETVAGVALSGVSFTSTASQRLYFEDYDEAVRTEVAILDHDRLGGLFP